jgi:hypothetical protein
MSESHFGNPFHGDTYFEYVGTDEEREQFEDALRRSAVHDGHQVVQGEVLSSYDEAEPAVTPPVIDTSET